jgi:DNA mismatch repair protein MutL
MDADDLPATQEKKEPYQIHRQFILTQIRSGFLLIDQQAASERILYERYLEALAQQPIATQQALFPKNLRLSTADAAILNDILPELNSLGFDIAPFGGTEFVIHGAPAEMGNSGMEEALLERVLAQFKENIELQLGIHENLARSMARNAAIKRGRLLHVAEMQELIDQLFACVVPYSSPGGSPCMQTYNLEDLQKYFSA